MLLIALCNLRRLKISPHDTFAGAGLFNFSDDGRIAIGDLFLDGRNKSTRLKKRILTLRFDLITQFGQRDSIHAVRDFSALSRNNPI
jgi:hypothetical protein